MRKKYQDSRYCENFGHDWAYQDCGTIMKRICLRCGQMTFFFPKEADYGPDMDDNGTKIGNE